MDNSTLTPGEYSILKRIVTSDYQSDFRIINNPVWQVTVTKEDRGYMSSCVKKGFAGVDRSDPGNETCWVTQNGYDAYSEYNDGWHKEVVCEGAHIVDAPDCPRCSICNKKVAL